MAAPPIAIIESNERCAWLIDLDTCRQDDDWDLLSADERERARRFRFDLHRRRYVSAHAGLRRLLSDRTGVAARALAFDVGAFGKPCLSQVPACHFNLSHSGQFAAVAISRAGEVGIDIEEMRDVPDLEALGAANFSPAEQAMLTSGGSHDAKQFLLGWTRKEACLKAIGTGLSVRPETFDAGLTAEEHVVQVRADHGLAVVRVRSFAVGRMVVGALAFAS